MSSRSRPAAPGGERTGARAGRDALTVALDVLPLVGQPSGVGAACRGLFEALVERPDVEVSAYAVTRRSFLARREVPRAVRFRGSPVPTSLVQRAWQLGGLPRAEQLARPADVVHGTNFAVPPSRRAATVVTVHDLTAARYPELCTRATLRYPALVRRAVDDGALVHVPSAFVRDEVVDLLGVPPDRVAVVAWGVPPVEEPTTTPPVEPPYVLALGTVEPRKDYPTLVEAFFELSAAEPELRLVVAGAEGWATGALTDAVSRRRLEDKVVRLGYVNEQERSALLWNASVLAYPSLYEGFGFPPLEAMAAGVPVVATRAGGVPEVVGEAALLVDPGDPASLAGAMRSALHDEVLRQRLVAAGRQRAGSFSWDRTAEEMVALYRAALGRRGS
ncbi:MAG TPA: glycosyltransferase family 1 protein [Acidimicrobiales bacterium]|nr:glycosyltransferase family 1 protein [Acidimicrobiales bacterium]